MVRASVVGATAVLLMLLFLLLLVVLVVQHVGSNGAGDQSANSAQGTSAKLVSNKGTSS